jgi:hypothetical protein
MKLSVNQSKETTTKFEKSLKVLLVLMFVPFLFSLLSLVAPTVYESVLDIELVAILIMFLAWLYAFVVGIQWMYRVHKDLNARHAGYPISPKQAMFRTLVPIYNIWGLWTILGAFHKYMQAKVGLPGLPKADMDQLKNLVFAAGIASSTLTRIIFRYGEETVPPYVYVLSAVSDLIFYALILNIVLVVKGNVSAKKAGAKALAK